MGNAMTNATKTTDRAVSPVAVSADIREGCWRVVSASVCGTSHEKTDIHCQDACRWALVDDEILVAAVADGAGSAVHSDVGSAVATRAAVQKLSGGCVLPADPWDRCGWESAMTDAFEAAVMAVEAEANERVVPVQELACTLMLVAATPRVTVAVTVGDGAVVVEDCQGDLLALTTPSHGEYLNETEFLTRKFTRTAQGRFWPVPPRHVAVFTDGLQMLGLRMPEATPHPPFFRPLFDFVNKAIDPDQAREELEAFLRSPRVRLRTDDDVTLLVADFHGG